MIDILFESVIMTRFKELQRIENAITNRDISELEWAIWYCESRLQNISISYGAQLRKRNEKHWNLLLKKIRAALDSPKE